MEIPTNTNERRLGKGISTVKYPGENVTQRFVAKDYVGEQSIDNETGLWEFSPKISMDSIHGLEETLLNQEVDFDYITVNDYRSSADIVPEPVPTANMVVSPSTVSVPEGQSGSFNITIDQQPTADVIVTIVSDDISTAEPVSGSVTFTTANWAQPQAVNFTTTTDPGASDRSTFFTVSVDSSTDARFTAIGDKTVNITASNTDNAGFVTTDNIEINSGEQGTFTISLLTQPSADVQFTITSPTTNLLVNNPGVTFTSSNWETSKTVACTAAVDAPSANINVTVTPSSSDSNYDSLPSKTVTYVVNEPPAIAPEVRIGNTIWRTDNENTDDAGEGIVIQGEFDSLLTPEQIQENYDNYGYLYNKEAVNRVVVANPGYRIPTINDVRDLALAAGLLTQVSTDRESFVPNPDSPASACDPSFTWITNVSNKALGESLGVSIPPYSWSETVGLNLRPGGAGFKLSTYLWLNTQSNSYYWVRLEDGSLTRMYTTLSESQEERGPSLIIDKSQSFIDLVDERNYHLSLRLVKDI